MIRIFIVDDHVIISEGLIAMFKQLKNFETAGVAATAKDCIEYFKKNTADVVLLDINLPDMNGLDLCKTIKQLQPRCHIIALTTFNQGKFVAEMLHNGASGYLLKNADKEEIVLAIETVLKGKKYLSEEAGKNYSKAIKVHEKEMLLTKREKEILKLIVDGSSNGEIAKALFISTDTVDTHRKNLYAKLNVKNIAALIRYSVENALT
jgi:DNA-binding NarL/FixJ family response regulator